MTLLRPTLSAPVLAPLALVVLAACQSASDAADGPAPRPEALTVAEALRGTDGVSGATVDGAAVVAVIDAPIPGAGLDEAARARIGDAAGGTFTAATCARAGLDAFFAGGGTLVLQVRGTDGTAIADVPVEACA